MKKIEENIIFGDDGETRQISQALMKIIYFTRTSFTLNALQMEKFVKFSLMKKVEKLSLMEATNSLGFKGGMS